MAAPLPPLPPKRQGSSAEKIVLITVIVVWVATGLAGLGLLASSVLASGGDEPSKPPVKIEAETKEAAAIPEEREGLTIAPPVPQFTEEEAKEDIASPREIQPHVPPENTTATPIAAVTPAVSALLQSTPIENTVSLKSAAAPTPTPHALEQAAVCTLSEQACIDLCPDGSAFDDGMDIGETAEWEVCEQACHFGRIRCLKGIKEDPCGHFHGACRYHCYEESYTEECEDSCDEGRDRCAAILEHKK